MSYETLVERKRAASAGSDLYTRIQMLASELIGEKVKANKRHHRLVGQYASYTRHMLDNIQALKLEQPDPEIIETLPLGSFYLIFRFRLARPLLSKDDEVLHICDNPMRKDRIFRVPMMSPSNWKGSLRSAATRLLASQAGELTDHTFATARLRLTMLFGNEKGVDLMESDHRRWNEFFDEKGGLEAAALYRRMLEKQSASGFLAGRLRFFPTFFDDLGIEVINPHDRKKKAGKLPIYFECVPIGANGAFALLYVPFNVVKREKSALYETVAKDLEAIAPALEAMLTLYGFGAKTSSGYGVVKDRLAEPGRLVLKTPGLPSQTLREPEAIKPKSKKKLRRYWKAKNQLRDEFLTAEGQFITQDQYQAYVESQGQEYTKSNRQLYEKAKGWWEREGKALVDQQTEEPEPEHEVVEQKWAERSFTSLEELVKAMTSLADQLRETKGGAR